MRVISLPASLGLGRELSELLRLPHEECQHKIFPDGESYLRINFNVSGDDFLLVQTMYPDQNRRLLELMMVAKTLKLRGARSVHALVPYLAYARQDREFLEGEVVSAKVVLKLLRYSGVDNLYVIDVHKPQILNEFDGNSVNIIAKRTFAQYLGKIGMNRSIVVAPDMGAKERAQSLAEALGARCLVIKKFRDRVTGEIRHELPEDVNVYGKDVVVIDDIISTGGTMSNIVSFLKGKGANRVLAIASHGLFIGNAVNRLKSAGADEIIVLDTVAKRFEGVTYLSVSKELADLLKPFLLR